MICLCRADGCCFPYENLCCLDLPLWRAELCAALSLVKPEDACKTLQTIAVLGISVCGSRPQSAPADCAAVTSLRRRHRVLKSGTVQSKPTSYQALHEPLVCRNGMPKSAFIVRQLWIAAPLQCFIVSRPVRGLVLRRGPTAHGIQLSCWIHVVNPSADLCNWATPT